jgi:hypothetical protein
MAHLQAKLLNTLTSRPDEIASSGKALTTAQDLISTVAASGASTGIDQSTADALGSTISSLFTVTDPDSDASQLSSSVDDVLRGAWAYLAPNEPSIVISADKLNVTNSVAYTYTLTNATLAPPGVNSSVALPPGGIAGLCPGADPTERVGLGMVSMSDPYGTANESTNSNVLRFSMSATGGCSLERGARRRLADLTDHMSVKVQTSSPNVFGVSWLSLLDRVGICL